MSEKRINDELMAIEAALGELTPTASGISRDRLFFLAGQASVDRVSRNRRRRVAAWFWPCATAASLMTAVVFGVRGSAGSQPTIVERIVYVPAERPAEVRRDKIATTASHEFADWRLVPTWRNRNREVPPRPSSPPARPTAPNSKNEDRTQAVQSFT